MVRNSGSLEVEDCPLSIGFFPFFNYRQPKKLGLTLWRRNRRVVVDPRIWEPTMKNPLKGMVVWPIPESKEVIVTVFKDSRGDYEDKDWNLTVEDVSAILFKSSSMFKIVNHLIICAF